MTKRRAERMNLALVNQLRLRVGTELSERRLAAERSGHPMSRENQSALAWELIDAELASEAKVRIELITKENVK